MAVALPRYQTARVCTSINDFLRFPPLEKIENVADRGGAERVDRLGVVADDGERGLWA